MDMVAAEVVSDLRPGLLPSGKGKMAPMRMEKWRGAARFSLVFLYSFLPCTWHHIGCTLGDIRGWQSKMSTQLQVIGWSGGG